MLEEEEEEKGEGDNWRRKTRSGKERVLFQRTTKKNKREGAGGGIGGGQRGIGLEEKR